MQHQIQIVIAMGFLLVITISIDLAYGAPVFTMKYYDGWSVRELPYGFLFTSPEKQLQFYAQVVPNEYVQSVFSTTDLYQIANNFFIKDKSLGNVQVINQPEIINSPDGKSKTLVTSYSINGNEKQVTLTADPYVVQYFQVIAEPKYINYYFNMLREMTKSIHVNFGMLPQDQALAAQNQKLIDDTLALGPNAIQETAEGFKKDYEDRVEECNRKLGYDANRHYC